MLNAERLSMKLLLKSTCKDSNPSLTAAQRLAMITKKEGLVTNRAQITSQVSGAMNTVNVAEKETSTVVGVINLLTQHVTQHAKEAIIAIMTRTKEEQIITIIGILATIETIETSVIINPLVVTLAPMEATLTAREEATVAVMTTKIDEAVVSREITKRTHLTRGEDLSRVIIPQVHKTSTDVMTIPTVVTVLDSSKIAIMIGISQEQALSIVAMDSKMRDEAIKILSLTDLLKVVILTRVVVLILDATPMTSITTRTLVTIEEVTLTSAITIIEVVISIIEVAIITISVVAHITVVKA